MRPNHTVVNCLVCGTPFRVTASRAADSGRGRFCSRPCCDAHRRIPLWRRVWENIDYGGDGCWPTTCAPNEHGYGVLTVSENGAKRVRKVTRLVWAAIHGPIPDGLWVLHRCDNPPCARPSHLFLGTPLDNVRDMLAKGRARPGNGQMHVV